MNNYETYDAIFEPVCVIDNNLKITYYNHYFATFFKTSPRVLKKSPIISELFSGFDLATFLEDINESKIGPEVEISLEDGSSYHVVIKAIKKANDTIICFNDISIEKNLYTKYRYQIQELKEIHNQIIQADKLSTIGEITATISHEISNPLTIASGNLELIEALISTEKLEGREIIDSSVNDTRDSINRITKIVKGLKSFLHNKNNEKEYVSLESIIKRTATLVKAPLNQANVKLNYDDSTSSIIHANPIEIEQVFVNLITNGIHALEDANTESAQIDISITQNDVCYIINVKDNGPGIPEEIKDKIFDSFYTTKEVGEGTGLGLAISSKIIDSYSGSLEVSDSDKGACFTITLPKMETTTFSDSELNSQTKLDKILVVDNEPQILNLFSSFFKDTEKKLIFASNANEAHRILLGSHIDTIICDYSMPGMNGIEFAESISDDISVPLYIMSGITDEAQIKEINANKNIAGFIEKPFTKEDLVKKVFKKEGK